MDSITRRMRRANSNSADSSDSMGVCPFCYQETDPGFKVAQRMHDLQYVMHHAGLSSDTEKEVDDNFAKNLEFADDGNLIKEVKAFGLIRLVRLFGRLFWNRNN